MDVNDLVVAIARRLTEDPGAWLRPAALLDRIGPTLPWWREGLAGVWAWLLDAGVACWIARVIQRDAVHRALLMALATLLLLALLQAALLGHWIDSAYHGVILAGAVRLYARHLPRRWGTWC